MTAEESVGVMAYVAVFEYVVRSGNVRAAVGVRLPVAVTEVMTGKVRDCVTVFKDVLEVIARSVTVRAADGVTLSVAASVTAVTLQFILST